MAKTAEDIKALVQANLDRKPEMVAALNAFGYKVLPDVPAEKYDELYTVLKNAVK